MITRVWVATIGSMLLAVTALNFAWAAAHHGDPLPAYVTSISAQIDPRPAEVISRIGGTGRQLLALRSYLRAGAHLPERWTWSPEQIAAFEGSPEQRDLQLEIDRVRTAFVAANPGFELYVNPQVRSLDTQIEHWNSNESVTAAAEEILAAGWAAKLDVAVREASRKFMGPLASPREPWHYTYTPEAVAPD
jgi:hypothetical protein